MAPQLASESHGELASRPLAVPLPPQVAAPLVVPAPLNFYRKITIRTGEGSFFQPACLPSISNFPSKCSALPLECFNVFPKKSKLRPDNGTATQAGRFSRCTFVQYFEGGVRRPFPSNTAGVRPRACGPLFEKNRKN